MALFIEAVGAEGVLQRAPVSGRDLQLTARPGLTYRLVRDADLPPDVNPAIKRYDNDLVLEDLPDGSTVRISGFFSNCTPEQVCALSLEGIGGGTGDVITPAAEPVAALADGGFLLRASSVQQAVLPVAPESEFPYKAALGGLALAGLAAGGGGGGGSDTPVAPAPPAAPVITSAKFTNDLTPVVSGTTTAGATVTVTFELPAQTFVTFETTADSAGHWSIDTGSTAALKPGSPPMPSGGLPANGDTTIQMLATNTAGSTSASDVITTDTTPPDATATIASVTDDQPGITGVLADGDTSNDPSPALAGTISRALVTGETVKVLRDGVVVGDAVVSGTTWTYTDTGVTDGATHVFTAGVYDALGNGSTPANSISLSFDLSAPATPTINVVAGDDIVNEAEGRGASPVVVTGTAEPGATVDLNWDTATLQVTAGTDGSWTASFAAVQVPADGIHALTASSSDAAGNVSTASRTVQVLTGKPSAPAFDAVEGDDLVSQAEAADGITFTGATSSGTTVAVTLNGVTVNAVVSGTTWSATFAPGSLPPDASGLTATRDRH
ncbi:MAG: Ig-like domain-containing protein [Burkholderiaceae bacterium]